MAASTRPGSLPALRLLALGSLAVLLLPVAASWSALKLSRAADEVPRVLKISGALEDLLSTVETIGETSRGFALNGEEAEVTNFQSARRHARTQLDLLASLFDGDPVQAAHLGKLKELVEARGAFGEQLIQTRRDHGFDAAAHLSATGGGRRLTDQIRAQIAQMQAHEEGLVESKMETAKRTARIADVVSFLIFAGAAVWTAGWYVYTRRTELRRLEHDRALRLSEERLRLLVESVTDYGIFSMDAGGHIQSWNPGARRLEGYESEEIIGKHFSIFYPEEAKARNHPAEELRLAEKNGRYEEEGFRVRKDGSTFWANVVITPIRDPAGTLIGFAKVTRDLSERRRQEEQRQILLERLQRSNSELQEFAMVASHDLQEPVRKIQMFVDRLRDDYGPKLDDTARDYLERMHKAANRGQSLIQGLLAFSRVTTRAQPSVPVNLTEVANEVVQDLEARLASVKGTVKVGTLPTVEADPLQMRQLVQNLIGNALKFHRPEIPPVVELSAEPIGGMTGSPSRWRVIVTDNGIGFDEKYLDRIFKLFQRLHDRGAYEGSGMGLAICRKIVERHSGTITARSTPGVGTKFLIELPVRQPRVEATA